MRYLYFIVMVLVLSCGEQQGNDGSVRHLVDGEGAGGRKSVIFATRQPNGQHCFYGGDVAAEVSLTGERVVQELAQDSKLLTPRTLSQKDVHRSLLAATKESNIASHLLSNPVFAPLAGVCYVSSTLFLFHNVETVIINGSKAVLRAAPLAKLAVVTCGVGMALQAGAYLFARSGTKAAGLTSRKLVSPHLHDASADELERLHKNFSWLESRDAMQCPATPELPTGNQQKPAAKEGK